MLEDNYSGAEPKLDAHQMSELKDFLEDPILPDAKSVINHIDKQYRVLYSVSGVTDLLHRLGFSYKKPTHVPGKQDPAKQQAFLEEYEQIKAARGENDPIYFTDATPTPSTTASPLTAGSRRDRKKNSKPTAAVSD